MRILSTLLEIKRLSEGRIFIATTLKHSNNNLNRSETQFTESDRSFKSERLI